MKHKMNILNSLFAIVLLAFFSACTSVQNDTENIANNDISKSSKKICRQTVATGSHIKQRDCRTQQAWVEADRKAQAQIDFATRNKTGSAASD